MAFRYWVLIAWLFVCSQTLPAQTVNAVVRDSVSVDGTDLEETVAEVQFTGYPDHYIVDSICVEATIGDDCSDYYSLSIALNDTVKKERVCNGVYCLRENLPLNNLKITVFSNDEDDDEDWITVTNKTTVYFHYQKEEHDIELLKWELPRSACMLSDTEQIALWLTNNGKDTENYIPLQISLDDAASWWSDTIYQTILPGDTILCYLSRRWDFSKYGRYRCVVAVDLSADTVYFNDTLTQIVENKTIAASMLPYCESFDGAMEWPAGWTTQKTRIYDWHLQNGPTATINTGPSAGYSKNGNYAYIEASDGFEGDTTWLISPCLNFDTVSSALRLSFWYHMYGSGISQLFTDAFIDSQWVSVDTICCEQQTNSKEEWYNRRIKLNNRTKRIRFWSYVKDNDTRIYGDIAIDEVEIYRLPDHDLKVTAMSYKTDICEGNDTIYMRILNLGLSAETDFQVAYSVDGGHTFTTETVSFTLLPDSETTYKFSAPAVLSQGTYAVTGVVTLNSDAHTQNDTLVADTIVVSPQVADYPYVQNFEAEQYWYVRGDNTSWQLGEPSASIINSAASGNKAWVTNLSGNYKANEYALLVSPCFDFSMLEKPMIEFDIFLETETYWDGLQLQYTTDGNNWKTLGKYNDWYHWYNYDKLSSIAENAPAWTGETGHWIHVKHILDFLAGEPFVKFRFVFASDADTQHEGVAVDNLNIHDYTDVALVFPENDTLLCGLNVPFQLSLKNNGHTTLPAGDTLRISYVVENDSIIERLVLGNDLKAGDTIVYRFVTQHEFSKDTLCDYVAWVNYSFDDIDFNDTARLRLAHYNIHIDLGGDTLYTYRPDTVTLLVDTNYDWYQWNIPDTNDYHLGIQEYGTYSVQVKDSNGCYLSGVIVITQPVFIENQQAEFVEKPYLYPNPATATVTVFSQRPVNSVEILDLQGHIVQVYTGNRTPMPINLSYLPSGMYMLRIHTDKAVYTAKLLKK